MNEKIRPFIFSLAALLLGGAILLMLHTRGHVIEPVYLPYLLLWLPVIFCAAGWPRPAAGQPLSRESRAAALLAGCLVLYLFSSSTDHPWFYFLTWLPRPPPGFYLLESQLGQFVLFAALLTPLLIRRPPGLALGLLALLLFAQAGSAWWLINETGGAALYRDDHPSTLYRLWEFCRTFPRPVNYNPFWNGGQISNHPVLTGTSALGLFILPFYKWLPLEQCYTPLIAAVFIGLVPLLAVGALRLMAADWPAAICAGILALGISQFYFLWLLYYGTLGALFSAAGLLPLSAGLFRVLILNKREWWTGIILIAAGYFLLMWPPNAVLALALGIGLLLNFRSFSWPKARWLAICAAAVVLLSWPRLMVIAVELWQGAYEQAGAPAAAAAALPGRLAAGYGNLVDYIRMGHPLLIFLGLGGAAVAVSPEVRRWFLPLLLLLLLLVGWGPAVMPGFQLFRMNVPLFFTAVIPAALAISALLRAGDPRLAILRAAVVALLIMGGLNTILLFGNNSRAPYEVLSPDGKAMIAWLRANAPENTRVLFAGATVHGYEGGHVAFLQYLTGREMLACDYYHFSPAVVEYDYPPRPWRKTPELFNRFLELYNVAVISTLRPDWQGYLRSRPAEYREEKSFGEGGALTFFRVLRPARSLLLAGQGRVKADFNRLEVELKDGHAPAVIKYNWQPGLVADQPAEIFPYHAGPGVKFIGINPRGQPRVVIQYKKWL